jgi:primosomal protein N' (replication factor Y)
VATGRADDFYASELAMRRRFGSPPFGAVIKLTVALEDRAAAEAEGEAMAQRLRERATGRGTAVAGPAPAYIARRNDRWRFNVVLRGADPRGVLGGDPGPPWSVDVDPESML